MNNSNFNIGIGNNVKNNKTPFKFDLKLILKLLIIANLAIVGFLVYKYFNLGSLTLLGDEDMKIYLNDKFIDPGYKGYDSKGRDITDKVVVSGDVDSTTLGNYEIVYDLNGIIKKRYVTVTEPKAKEATTYILLEGEDIVYLKQSDKYKEPGYKVIDSKETGLSDKVVVSGDIDTEKPGTYKLTYSVTNSDNVTVSASRTVIVIGTSVTYTVSPKEYTKEKVTINLLVDDNYMEYVLLPNNEKSTEKAINYEVSKNGSYKFTIYSKGNLKTESVINVSNIDKESPKVNSCTVEWVNNEYQITVSASDKAGIKSYDYYVSSKKVHSSESSKYSYTGEINNPYVIVNDMLDNSTKAECTIVNNIVSAKVLGKTLPTSMIEMAQISTFIDGKVVENYAYNCSDNTSFYTSSVSKMMLGIIAAKMVEDGLISLDLSANKYWNELASKNFSNTSSAWKSYLGLQDNLISEINTGEIPKVFTLRNLLTHSSSIKNLEYPYIDPEDTKSGYIGGSAGKTYNSAIKILKNESIYDNSFVSGAKTNYDYLNDANTREHAVAGLTMQSVINESLNEYLNKNILSKLKTNSSPSFMNGNSIYFSTGYKSSANDLAMIAAAIANDGVYNSTRVFGSTAINSLKKIESGLRNQTIAFDYKDKKYVKYGILSDIANKDYYDLSSVVDKYTSYVILDFDTKSGVVINMKLKSSVDKSYAFNVFNSISAYFYS